MINFQPVVLHADVHPGHILIKPNGNVTAFFGKWSAEIEADTGAVLRSMQTPSD